MKVQVNDGEWFYIYTVNWIPAAGPIYVAMRPVADNNITVTVQKSSVYYQKTFTDKTLAANKFYPITVMLPLQTMQEVPLTFEATQAGTNVTFSINAVASNPVSYRSFTGGAWSSWATYTSGTAISLAEVGDKVQFKGTNARYASSNVAFSHFTCSKNCKLYGNIMSLINASSFAQLTSLTGEYAFCLLFNNRKGDVNVLSDPDKPLLSVKVETTEDGDRTLPVEADGKTALAIEEIMANGNSAAAQGLYGDIQANGLGTLMSVAMQQVPELGSLMGQMGQAS